MAESQSITTAPIVGVVNSIEEIDAFAKSVPVLTGGTSGKNELILGNKGKFKPNLPIVVQTKTQQTTYKNDKGIVSLLPSGSMFVVGIFTDDESKKASEVKFYATQQNLGEFKTMYAATTADKAAIVDCKVDYWGTPEKPLLNQKSKKPIGRLVHHSTPLQPLPKLDSNGVFEVIEPPKVTSDKAVAQGTPIGE